MTVPSRVDSPSVGSVRKVNSKSRSESGSDNDESLPPHTSEIGTLKKLPNHGTAWLGSSSGVYFVNTVRRAFSAAFASTNCDAALPATEDILTGDDDEGRNYNGPVIETSTCDDRGVYPSVQSLGKPPSDKKLAMELVKNFFRCWHPLFPFLHGPRFLKDMDSIYASNLTHSEQDKSNFNSTAKRTPIDQRKLVTFQIIINLASLDRPDIVLPQESRIKSTADVSQVAGCIAVRHDMETIQACMAAELYLVATICLRQASIVAGIILKLIYHAGLHRCPLRYAQLSLEDCEIRKRVFWSAYALDRYLSLSLGDPNTVQDSDIDVCLSGRELHKAVARDLLLDPSDEIQLHLPSQIVASTNPNNDPRLNNMNTNNNPQAREKQIREAAMTAYVNYGKLTGRIVEIFHKSIHARFPKSDAITYLNSDIENWWNQLPASLTNDDNDNNNSNKNNDSSSTSSSSHPITLPTLHPGEKTLTTHHHPFTPFFSLLYQQLLLLLHRPRLSLPQSSADFQHALQICIKASRASLTALKRHKDNGMSMLLPGLFSASWMSGLIIAFGWRLGKVEGGRACSDITTCLEILSSMGSRHWFTVKNCHRVLSLLLANIRSGKVGRDGFLVVGTRTGTGPGNNDDDDGVKNTNVDANAKTKMNVKGNNAGNRKREHQQDEDDPTVQPLKRHGSRNVHSPPNSFNSRKPTSSNNNNRNSGDTNEETIPTSMSMEDVIDQRSTSSNGHSHSTTQRKKDKNIHQNTMTMNNTQHAPNSNPQFHSPSLCDELPIPFETFYAPVPESTQTQTYNQNPDPNQQYQLPQLEDPMFWGNLDYNMSDIFSAASWENMTGMSGPIGGNGMGSFWSGFEMNPDGGDGGGGGV